MCVILFHHFTCSLYAAVPLLHNSRESGACLQLSFLILCEIPVCTGPAVSGPLRALAGRLPAKYEQLEDDGIHQYKNDCTSKSICLRTCHESDEGISE